jgi:hypothetical protein
MILDKTGLTGSRFEIYFGFISSSAKREDLKIIRMKPFRAKKILLYITPRILNSSS